MAKKLNVLGKRKLVKLFKTKAEFKIMIEGKGMVCPYCLLLIPCKAEDNETAIQERATRHFLGSCTIFENADTPTSDFKHLNAKKEYISNYYIVRKLLIG